MGVQRVNEELSYEALIGGFIDARVGSDTAIWRQAAIAYILKEKLCVATKTISGDVGFSPRYITNLAKAFGAFPEESDRALDLSFSHHLVAATTDNPKYWIDQSTENAYSVRELSRAIRGDVLVDPVAVAKRVWEKVEGILEQDNEGSEYIRERILGWS